MVLVMFPEKAFYYLEKNNLISGIYKYITDHRFRTSVHLHSWIKEQLVEPDIELKDLVESIIKPYVKDDYDILVSAIFKWVNSNLVYNGDHKLWGTAEKWQTARETLTRWYIKKNGDVKLVAENFYERPEVSRCFRSGDCEDGAILIYVMCRIAGVPANRLLIFAGNVLGGGHSWLAYRPSTDPYNLCFADWCYFVDRTGVSTRKRYWVVNKQIIGDSNYYNMWFAFNEKYTYLNFKPTGDK